MKALNPWTDKNEQAGYYELDERSLVYKNGDYRIYKEFSKSYIYTFKNVAISNLAGVNKELVDALASRTRPLPYQGLVEEYTGQHLLYDRAMKVIKEHNL